MFVKLGEDPLYVQLYREILEPYHLNSPVIYGHVETPQGQCLVAEWIPNKVPDLRIMRDCERVMAWLARKDSVIAVNLPRIQDTGYIRSAQGLPGPLEQCLRVWREALDIGWPPPAARSVLEAALARGNRLQALAREISERTPVTLVHRDLSRENILFGIGERSGEIFVVDWSHSIPDSVCMDLAVFLDRVPPSMRPGLVRLYRAQCDFNDFEAMLARTELLLTIFRFAWAAWAINSGQRTWDTPSFRQHLERAQVTLDTV